jgi:amino acid transporter
LVIGIKESAVLNNVFTFVNLIVIALVIIVGLTKIRGHNWQISPNEVKTVVQKINFSL